MQIPACPDTIEDRFSAFLEEPIWVCWSEVDRAGRKVKLPINPLTGKAASVAQPATWASHDCAKRFGRKTGVGIVLTSTRHGRLVGFDLDSCRNPETGVIEEWANLILDIASSYSEVSPSGTGLKIFAVMTHEAWTEAKGLLNAGADRLGASWKAAGQHHPPGVELYLGGRYFTVTGSDHDGKMLRSIAPADIASAVRLCQERFRKPLSSDKTARPGNSQGRDISESGRAFRVCLAAIRHGVPMDEVPAWAARLADRAEHEDYAVSSMYWFKPRGEGTQLSRDYARAQAFGRRP